MKVVINRNIKYFIIGLCLTNLITFWVLKINQDLDGTGRGIHSSSYITIDFIIALLFTLLFVVNVILINVKTFQKIHHLILILWILLNAWLVAYNINYNNWFPFSTFVY
ncbi:MAG: hypothetical protein IPL12_14000 [Bacteroidetes bacterium]|nr:hypothetical protein [Bacteroidota bacterium]